MPRPIRRWALRYGKLVAAPLVSLPERWRPWVACAGLALLILGPLLAPGYILTLDLIWGPRSPHIPGIMPAWVTEKLLLFTLFTMAGVGAYRLLRRVGPGWPAYVGALFFVVNPFSYERFMGGQWLVLAGFALLPWVADAFLRVCERPGWRSAVMLATWSSVLAVASLHTIAMMLMVCGALGVAAIKRPLSAQRPVFLWLAVAAGLTLMVAGYWVLPSVTGHSGVARDIQAFDLAQFKAFRTDAGTLGVPLNIVTLQGFWRERAGEFALVTSAGFWFWLGEVPLLVVMASGLVAAFRRRHRVMLALTATGLVAAVLAAGITWAPTAGITQFLVEYLPGYRGYREPGKWIAVLALAEAAMLAYGLATLRPHIPVGWRWQAAITAGALPLIACPLILWGASGQLRSTAYPASWRDLNHHLNALPLTSTGRPDVVILPWHQYLSLPFAGRVVAQPAPVFFDRPVIISGDPQLPGVTPTGSLAQSIQTNVINQRFFGHNAGTALNHLGVHYVVLLKVSDWSTYGWLASQSDLMLQAETTDWRLYKTVNAP